MDFINGSVENSNTSTFKARCKSARKKRLDSIKKRFFVVLVFWILIIAYLVSPLSKARIIQLSGNISILNSEDIYSIAGFSNSNFLWSINSENIENELNNYQYIKNSTVDVSPLGVKIELNEISVVGKKGNYCENYGDDCTYYLSDGKEVNGLNNFKAIDVKHIAQFGSIPFLLDEDNYTNEQFLLLLDLLGKTEKNVRNEIASISKNDISTTTVVDFVFKANDLNLSNDLLLIVDLGSIDKKLTEKNIDIIRNSILTSSPSLKDDKYCYIYRAADYALPCD